MMITKELSSNSGFEFIFRKDRRVGEILLELNLINKEILEDALEYQKKYGGNTTQYFLKYGYITEDDLARAISSLTGCPYLPLSSYEISRDVINLIPPYIAEKYWLIPVDKMGEVITVVMANPCDKRVIQEIEDITHCNVRPFVGITSEIAQAIARYYEINVVSRKLEHERKIAPLFIREKTYKGLERRKALRIKVAISMRFAEWDVYRSANTKNLSRYGISFNSPDMPLIGSIIKLKINLPKKVYPNAISAVGQVARISTLRNKRFNIGIKIVNIKKEDADKLISYAIRTVQRIGDPASAA